MAENQDTAFNVTFNQMQDTEQEIRALIRQRANLPMQYDSSSAMYNEMTDDIKEKCSEYADLCNDLAIKADATRKPKHDYIINPFNPQQDSSKMPNPDYIPPTTSDDIPF